MKSKSTTRTPVPTPPSPTAKVLAEEVYLIGCQIEQLMTTRTVLLARLEALGGAGRPVTTTTTPIAPPRAALTAKRVFSTAAKRRMSAGMRKFWAKRKAAAKAKQLARVGKTVSKALQKEHIAARRKVRLAAAKPAKMAKAAKPVPTTATGAEG